jgi:hypothetical protein
MKDIIIGIIGTDEAARQLACSITRIADAEIRSIELVVHEKFAADFGYLVDEVDESVHAETRLAGLSQPTHKVIHDYESVFRFTKPLYWLQQVMTPEFKAGVIRDIKHSEEAQHVRKNNGILVFASEANFGFELRHRGHEETEKYRLAMEVYRQLNAKPDSGTRYDFDWRAAIRGQFVWTGSTEALDVTVREQLSEFLS